MANPEHIELVQQGREAIEQWREQHPEEHLDLVGADLDRVNLTAANLVKTDLRGASLRMAKLNGANLSWTDLTEANLSEAELNLAKLSRAFLARANLSGAKLFGIDLSEADLSNANLMLAHIFQANASKACLRQADLTGAWLMLTDLTKANLEGTIFTKVLCYDTVFANCNLCGARGLDSIVHLGPSSIGIDTLIASFRGAGNRPTPELETFFRGAGVPKELLDELPRIIAEIPYCTCFIAYGEPDRAFAEKLVKDLRGRGLSCWAYFSDYTPGERTWRELGQERQKAEKMVVLCSAPGLVKEGLLKEIEEQIDENPDKMVPVSLDNLWKEPGFRVMRGNRDLKPFLLPDRNYADFTKPYEEAVEQLLKGLRRKRS